MDQPGQLHPAHQVGELTIPCVAGPYTSVNCTLTLVRNSLRKSTTTSGTYKRTPNQDKRFADSVGAIQSIATSSALTDSGLFEVSFRDERYLPFESAGAISQWRIELPHATNNFDFNTISDVVLHLKYTAREGGQALRQKVLDEVVNVSPQKGVRFFSAKHEFPSDWYSFFHPADNLMVLALKVELTRERFPFQFRNRNIAVSRVELFLKLKDDASNPGGELLNVTLTPPAARRPVNP